MARTMTIECDGCGSSMESAALVNSLQMQIYHRNGTGIVETLEFSWDDGDPAADPPRKSCGHRVVEALRTAFGQPELGYTNENTRNPLLPNSTSFIPYVSPVPTPPAETPLTPGPDNAPTGV